MFLFTLVPADVTTLQSKSSIDEFVTSSTVTSILFHDYGMVDLNLVGLCHVYFLHIFATKLLVTNFISFPVLLCCDLNNIVFSQQAVKYKYLKEYGYNIGKFSMVYFTVFCKLYYSSLTYLFCHVCMPPFEMQDIYCKELSNFLLTCFRQTSCSRNPFP